ncbi:hypothetical protein QOM21_34940 [Streptomyces sp. Pv4-95]|uniref:hypothetical protein n=1 Tax=Streptomyces sp. Pv4-95 TaxID=3049543 RepID=UPI003891D4FB
MRRSERCRQGCVKGGRRAVRKASTGAANGRKHAFLKRSDSDPDLFQECLMADVAFIVTTIAVFALVAFIAKGVAKL